jgi:V/A-type H+-transporting ATPase subunit C
MLTGRRPIAWETSAGGFEYGNARLLARKGTLLTEVAYDRLLGRDIDGLLSALSDGSYRPDVQAAIPRYRGLRALHHALSANLARTLGEVRSFYLGRPGEMVELLLDRADARNLVTLVRAQVRRTPAEEALELVVPTGALDAVACEEIARRPDLRAAVDLLVAWGVPHPAVAHAVRRALPAYERTADLASLEHAIVRSCAAILDDRLSAVATAAAPLEDAVRAGFDADNVVLALRLRTAREDDEPSFEGDPFVPGGGVAPAILHRAVEADTRDDAMAALSGARLPAAWIDALAGWAADGDLVLLERRLEVASTLRALGSFRADPLGVGVPVAFVAAKENEVRNLRLLGHGARDGIAPGLLRQELVMPW